MAPTAGRRPLLGALAAAVLLSGCAYHAGDEAARSFDAWVAQHPLIGATFTDETGTNVQPFQGALQADARLTAKPTSRSIVAAMRSMCRFDSETSARTTYWLLVGVVWLQAPCDTATQERLAKFWGTVGRLPGVHEVDLSPKGAYVAADDDVVTAVVPTVSAAVDRTGYAKAGNAYRSDRVSIDQPQGADVSRVLALVQGVLDSVGTRVRSIRATTTLVSAATSGSVAQAHAWQQQVGHGDARLVVTPARTSTERELSTSARGVLDTLSTRAGVSSVVVGPSSWTISTPTTGDARGLVTTLDGEAGTSDLGRLVLDVGPGEGRTCDVRPVLPERSGRAAALLDLCDQPGMVEVDDRFDTLGLRLQDGGVRPMLAALHRLPAGQVVYATLQDNSTIQFTTGPELEPQFPDSPLGRRFVAIWRDLS